MTLPLGETTVAYQSLARLCVCSVDVDDTGCRDWLFQRSGVR